MKWEKVKLGDICEFAYGKSLPSKARSGNGYPVYGSNGEVGLHDKALTQSETIIIGRKGSFGEINYCPGPCSPIDTTYYITKENTDAHIPWLARRLKCLGLNNLNRAAAIPGLNRADAYRQNLLLPPLEEQKRIAGILDAADALRAKRRESLAKLDDLLQSTFLDMFGDPVTNPKGWDRGIVGDLLDSANYGTSNKADLHLGDYPILRMNNITYSGEWNFKDLKYIDLEEKDLPKHLVHKGQILFNRTNSKELVGKTAVYRKTEPMAFAGYLVRAITNDRTDPEYVGAFMNFPTTKQFLRNKCKNIVGMANINAKEFQKIPTLLPPLDLQQRFAKIVTSVEEQKAKMKKHLEQLDDLFASLQQRAFRGDL